MKFKFNNAIIFGANGDIGRAFCRQVSGKAETVTLVSRNQFEFLTVAIVLRRILLIFHILMPKINYQRSYWKLIVGMT